MTGSSSFVDLIKSVLPKVSDPKGIDLYEPDSADFQLPRLSNVTAPPEVLLQVTNELRKIEELANLEGGVIRNSPSSESSPLKLEGFANWVLAQSRFRPAEECVEELLTTVRRNNSSILEIIPVWGISPKVRFDLDEGLSVVPISELPPSRLKDLMTGKKRHAFSFEIANSSPKPGAAIIRQTIDGPLFEGPKSQAAMRTERRSQLMLAAVMSPTQETKREAFDALAQMMDPVKAVRESTSIALFAQELSEVIALLVSKPIFALAQWYQRPPNTPLLGAVGAYGGPTNDHPFYLGIEQQDYPIDEIKDLVRQYLGLDQNIRKRLRTPLVRLNQGRRHLEHHSVEAAAVDLGIAAEALLTQDREHDAPISFVLRVRGSLMLGGTAAEKKKNYGILRDLYGLRSRVAHDGSIVDRDTLLLSQAAREDLRTATEQAKAGQGVCIALITSIIRQGSFPDWEQLMFGQ